MQIKRFLKKAVRRTAFFVIMQFFKRSYRFPQPLSDVGSHEISVEIGTCFKVFDL
jgi:hypothetical protein